MARPVLELADIFRQHGADFRRLQALSPQQRRVMRAIEVCRTRVLGGHVDQCDTCSYQRVSYNSYRNRHCPKCQSLARARWLAARLADLLPVPYFHVVFTLPQQLAALALQNQRLVYNILFATAAKTLRTIAADPKHLGAEIGCLAVLHTWSQTLRHHPHLHCVVGNRFIISKTLERTPLVASCNYGPAGLHRSFLIPTRAEMSNSALAFSKLLASYSNSLPFRRAKHDSGLPTAAGQSCLPYHSRFLLPPALTPAARFIQSPYT